MKQLLPFDEKNVADYSALTKKISTALEVIEKDRNEPATKSNLARLSGVHRNTLRNRALGDSRDGKMDNGWPLQALANIKRERSRKNKEGNEELPHKLSIEDELLQLNKELEKRDYVATKWWHRTMEIKRERDTANRQVQILLEQSKNNKEEIDRLRKQLQKSMRVIRA
ncbi:MAG TPA: hypothetical protein VGK47_06245 [Nitrososphaeraceae archaeon]